MRQKAFTRIVLSVLVLGLAVFPIALTAGENTHNAGDVSLKDLINPNVITASLYEQKHKEAPSNIIVITKKMIERRGYKNLVEICRDIPGFDFATYEDGGGEFPVHNYVRGIGGVPGSPGMLIMVDGILQNFINFGWSTLWTDEQMLIDVERIEIIQGPGSVTHGSNAYSGIINIITEKNYEGFKASVWYGQHNSRALDLFYGTRLKKMNFSVALRKYSSDGDGGTGRYDPGNFFHDLTAPAVLTKHYDGTGQYHTDFPNPEAGRAIPDGFNASKDDTSVRLRFSLGNGEIGFFYWDRKDGLGSYSTGFEYYANDPNRLYHAHTRGYHIYGKYRWDLLENKLKLDSTVIYRTTIQMPDTGFEYTYKFGGMAKTYNTFNFQGLIEERLHYKIDESNDLIGSFRVMTSLKTSQIVSLNQIQDQYSSSTTSSYDEADNGTHVLGMKKAADTLNAFEYAGVFLWNSKFSKKFRSSLGIRYDHSSEYGSVLSPRFGLILNPMPEWTVKLLYGTAFRQPSLFELKDEFRGNEDLEPEKISTYEIENGLRVSDNVNVRLNIFYSLLKDAILLEADPEKAGEQKHFNTPKYHLRGFSIAGDFQPISNLYVYANYMFTEGKNQNDSWGQIDHTAKHKLNVGFNWLVLNEYLNINCRLNYVGKRKAPVSNTWMQNHEGGYAPAYKKVDLVLTLNNLFPKIDLKPQVIVKNLFDEKYYGVGRQDGASNRDEWDPLANPNPTGFIPAYHPQPGITFMFNLRLSL